MKYLQSGYYDAEYLIFLAIQDLENRLGVHEAFPRTQELNITLTELQKLPPTGEAKQKPHRGSVTPIRNPQEVA